MKRYKLKRDIPAFKAGTECYIEEAGHMVPCRGISYTIVHKDQLEKNPNILTDWFEEIKPAEPLIKDEKIRKAVRAWAEANAINSGHYYNTDIKFNVTEHRFQWIQTAIEFNDIMGLDNLEDGETYTIDELCGEEEE